MSVGVKHIVFWSPDLSSSKKGLFGKKNPNSTLSCVAFGGGFTWTGESKGDIFKWKVRVRVRVRLRPRVRVRLRLG